MTLTTGQANPRDTQFIAAQNSPLLGALDSDYEALGRVLERRGVAIDQVTKENWQGVAETFRQLAKRLK